MACRSSGTRQAAVNYITEIREFYSRLLIIPLSAHAQALWHRLMYHWNNAFWRLPLAGLSESQLCGEVGLNHKQFIKARLELVNGGYVQHIPQKGRMPPLYNMVILSAQRAICETPLYNCENDGLTSYDYDMEE